MTISIKQDAHRETKTWWEWSVWLEGTAEELADISKVVYTLHPSFVDPVHEIKTRSNGFKLKSMGWGEFELHLALHFKDGKVRNRKHWVKLVEPPKPILDGSSSSDSARSTKLTCARPTR